MTWIVLRSALASVFAVASIAKLADRAGTRAAVSGFGVPGSIAPAVAVVVPFLEAAAAAMLIPATTARYGAGLALVLLLAFMVGIALNLAAGRALECNCFGEIHSVPVGPSTLVRNAALAAVATAIAFASGPDAGGGVLDRASNTTAAVVSAVAVAAALFLIGRRGRLALDTRHGDDDARGPAVGSVPPAFSLEDLNGERKTLEQLVERGLGVMLVFVSPSCGSCRRIAPELAEWQARFPTRVTVVALISGTLKTARARAAEYGLSEVLVDPSRTVERAFGSAASPGAVLVGRDGLVASRVVAGEAAIRDLMLDAFGIRPLVESLRTEGSSGDRPDVADPGRIVDPDSIEGSFVPTAREAVAMAEHDGQSLLVDRVTGGVHLLNPAAALVWQCLDGSGSVDEIAADVAGVFGVPEDEARGSILEAVRGFGRQGLLEGVGVTTEEAAQSPASA